MKPKVYLAGPIKGLSYGGATTWRDEVRSILEPEIEVFSPMRAKSYLSGKSSVSASYDQYPLSTPRAITTRDRFDTTRCDLVLVNLMYAETVSIGTVMEVAWADAARRPVILVMEEGGIHDHPMVREVVGFRAGSVEGAAEMARAILLP
jgi:nucleoside 2-deoxyribosyltransferase